MVCASALSVALLVKYSRTFKQLSHSDISLGVCSSTAWSSSEQTATSAPQTQERKEKRENSSCFLRVELIKLEFIDTTVFNNLALVHVLLPVFATYP